MSYQRIQLIDTAALGSKYSQMYSEYYSQQPSNLHMHQQQNQKNNQKYSYNKENISPVNNTKQNEEKQSTEQQQKQLILRINSNFSNKINILSSRQSQNAPVKKQCKFVLNTFRIDQIRGSLDQLQIPQMQLAVNNDNLKLQTQRDSQKASIRQSPRIFDKFPLKQNTNAVYKQNNIEKEIRQMSLQPPNNYQVESKPSKENSIKELYDRQKQLQIMEHQNNRYGNIKAKINNFIETSDVQNNQKEENPYQQQQQIQNNNQETGRAKSEQQKMRECNLKFSQQQQQNNFGYQNNCLLKHQNSLKSQLSNVNITQMEFNQLFSLYYIPELIQSFQNSTSNDYFSQLFSSHFTQTMQAFVKINQWQSQQSDQFLEKQISLGPKQNLSKFSLIFKWNLEKTVIFDLDETLIHCIKDANIPGDATIPIKFPNGETISIKISIRPYLKETLQILSKYYEIIVFTASQSNYANPIIDFIDPEGLISCRLYRDNCIKIDGAFCIKDLRIIKNRNLEEMLIIDNIAFSYALNVGNGVPIIPFYNNKQDNQLINLACYLKTIYRYNKIALLNNYIFKLFNLQKFQNPKEFVRCNYLENLKNLYR